MKIEVKKLLFNEKNGEVRLEIKSDNKLSKEVEFLFQRRQTSANMMLYAHKIKKVELTYGMNNVIFNIDEVIDITSIEEMIDFWDVFIIIDNNRVGLSLENVVVEKFEFYVFKNNNLFKVLPFKTVGSKTLAFKIELINIECKVTNLSIKNGELELEAILKTTDINIFNHSGNTLGKLEIARIMDTMSISRYSVDFVIKKRVNNSLIEYNQEYILNYVFLEDKYIITEDLKSILSKNELLVNTFDLFVRIESKFDIKLEIEEDVFKYLKDRGSLLEGMYKIQTYQNKYISILKSNNRRIWNVNSIVVDDMRLIISGKLHEELIKNINNKFTLISKKRRQIGTFFEYTQEREVKIDINGDEFFINTEFDKLYRDIEYTDIWDLYVREYDGEDEIYPLYANNEDKNKKYISKEKEATLFVNNGDKYSIWGNFAKRNDNGAISIAVLGTCFSRNPFNSSDYFNPTYKKIYNCTYTQFHSGIISLVSSPIEFERKKLDNKLLRKSDLNFIETDFKKDFFEKLKEINPDYLLIDLYVDACREIIKIDNNKYITLNYLLPRTEYFKEIQGKKVIGHKDNEEYFALWEEKLDLFFERLFDAIPKEKVILNRGRLTEVYKDSDNNVKYFPDNGIIKRNNYFWDKLENCFLDKVPDIKTLDMRKTGYMGSYKHPFGNTFAHYESGYYKEFLCKLNEIILIDKIKDRE